MKIGIYRTDSKCYFLVSEQESNQRNRPGRGITGKSHPRPGPHSRRSSHRPPKMSRFSAGSAEKTFSFAECKRSKIGTFLNAGWRCGGWILKEGAFARSASLSRLLLALFVPKQEKGVRLCRFDKYQFERKMSRLRKEPGHFRFKNSEAAACCTAGCTGRNNGRAGPAAAGGCPAR